MNLNPNFVLQLSIFIHLCEAFLGIDPHFNLFRHFFLVRKYGGDKVVGGATLVLREKLADSYISVHLATSNKGWHKEWFYVQNPSPPLSPEIDRYPEPRPSWTSVCSERDQDQVDELVGKIKGLREQGLTGVGVAINFVVRRVNPCKERVHPAYEYEGRKDASRESGDMLVQSEVIARLQGFFDTSKAPITAAGCPSVYDLRIRPMPQVC